MADAIYYVELRRPNDRRKDIMVKAAFYGYPYNPRRHPNDLSGEARTPEGALFKFKMDFQQSIRPGDRIVVSTVEQCFERTI